MGLITLFLFSFNPRKADKNTVAYPLINKVKDLNYKGQIKDGGHFNFNFKFGKEISENQMAFYNIQGQLISKEKENFLLHANEGFVLKDKQKVTLQGGIIIHNQDGLTIETKSIEYDLKQGIFEGNEGITGTLQDAKISAKKFCFHNENNQITLSGNPELVITLR